MSTSKVLVSLNQRNVKVGYSNFESLYKGVKTKLNLSSEAFNLEYLDTDTNTWIMLCGDDDLEDISPKTQIRVVLEESGSEERLMTRGGANNYASHGAAAYRGNAQYVGGNVSGRMVGRDYIDGDKITATNMAKVGRHEGTMHIGGSQPTTNNQFSGAISGDQLHFGVGGNIKH